MEVSFSYVLFEAVDVSTNFVLEREKTVGADPELRRGVGAIQVEIARRIQINDKANSWQARETGKKFIQAAKDAGIEDLWQS